MCFAKGGTGDYAKATVSQNWWSTNIILKRTASPHRNHSKIPTAGTEEVQSSNSFTKILKSGHERRSLRYIQGQYIILHHTIQHYEAYNHISVYHSAIISHSHLYSIFAGCVAISLLDSMPTQQTARSPYISIIMHIRVSFSVPSTHITSKMPRLRICLGGVNIASVVSCLQLQVREHSTEEV